MSVIRVFFAMDLSAASRAGIAKILADLRNRHSTHGIRWTDPSRLHLTLHFIGSLDQHDLASLIQNVRTQIINFPSFELEFGCVELFPTQYKPHVIALTAGPLENHQELVMKIGAGILATGYEIERRPFRPHITLARINRWSKDWVLEKKISLEKMAINKIVLYQSILGKEGSQYSVLEEFPLKK